MVKQIRLLPETKWTRAAYLTIATMLPPGRGVKVGIHASADGQGTGFLVSRFCGVWRVWRFTI